MSTNEAVKEYLDYYLSSKFEADFAVLLNGPWGGGKTHFIKSYLQEREVCNSSTAMSPPAGHLYASLYGIRSTSEITDQFFAQTYPVINSKAVRLAGTLISRALNGWVGADVNNDVGNRSAIKDMMLKLEGRALIFDDLERCAMPLVEVMGFINSFVEHDGLKVIVIANEDDIPPDQRTEYTQKKEKLFGKTLRVTSDPNTVLDAFRNKMNSKRVRDIIIKEEPTLLRIFNESKKHNFRSLRSILSDYERIVSAVDSLLKDSDDAMARLLHFMLATGIEFRCGNLSASELKALPGTRQTSTVFDILNKEKSPQIVKLEGLQARYPDVQWSDPIVPSACLATLFETGIVSVEDINTHLSQHPVVVGYAVSPAWRQLWNWTELPRCQYLKARNEFVRQLNARELTHPGIILHAADIIIRTKEFGDFMLGNNVDVVAFFALYVQELQQSGQLVPDRRLFRSFLYSYEGLGYTSTYDADFTYILEKVQAATNQSFANHMKNVAGTFIDRISSDSEAYSSLHEHGIEENNYGDAPFLHYIDPDTFARVMIRDSLLDCRLLACLHTRFEMEQHNRALGDEYHWIKALRSSLESFASASETPHRKLLYDRIEYYFNKIELAITEHTSVTDSIAGEGVTMDNGKAE